MCDERAAMDEGAVRDRLKTIRTLIQSARDRIVTMRPAWGVYLTTETLSRLRGAIDELEKEIGLEAGGHQGAGIVSGHEGAGFPSGHEEAGLHSGQEETGLDEGDDDAGMRDWH